MSDSVAGDGWAVHSGGHFGAVVIPCHDVNAGEVNSLGGVVDGAGKEALVN